MRRWIVSYIFSRDLVIIAESTHRYSSYCHNVKRKCSRYKILCFYSAQREGLLSEAHSEEVDQADPFYAHCKLHSDKSLVRRRRRNFLALQLRVQQRQHILKQPNHLDTDEHRRIERKLGKHRHKYLAHKASRPPPWSELILSLNIYQR